MCMEGESLASMEFPFPVFGMTQVDIQKAPQILTDSDLVNMQEEVTDTI